MLTKSEHRHRGEGIYAAFKNELLEENGFFYVLLTLFALVCGIVIYRVV
jgi:hypothetical protein